MKASVTHRLKAPSSTAVAFSRPNSRAAFSSRQRKIITPIAAIDPASADIVAAFTAVAASTVTILSLAKIIRQANGFDKPAVVETIKPIVAIAEETTENFETVVEEIKHEEVLVMAPSAAAIANKEQARSWISNWKSKPKETIIEEPVVTSSISTETTVAEVRSWISDWRSKSQNTIPTATPTDDDIKPDPAVAAAVLTAMTADTPVGSTISIAKEESKEQLLVTAATGPTPADDTDAVVAEKEVESQRTQRVVTVSDTHLEKISTMWATFKEQAEKKTQLLAKQEKLTLDIAELEAVEEETKKVVVQEQKNILQNILAFFLNIWVVVVAFVTGIMSGHRFGNGNASA